MSNYISKWTLGYKESGTNESGLLGWERKLTDASVENGYVLENSPTEVDAIWCVNAGGSAIVPGSVVKLTSSAELIYSVETAGVSDVVFGIADPELSGNIAVGEKFNVIRKGVTLVLTGAAVGKDVPIGVNSSGKSVASSQPFGRMIEVASAADQLKRARVNFYNVPPVANRSQLRVIRTRATAAQVNAGLTMLAALPGLAYRVHDVAMISIGGNASGATTVDVLATQSASSVKIMASAVAGLTQNTLLRAGATNGAILAGGLSFVTNDVNTAITIGKTGSDLATSTHIDVLLTYEIV